MRAQLIRGAYCWSGGLAVDADGCPYAYAPAGSPLRGLDLLANAGKPGDWFGVVTDNGKKTGKPIVQKTGAHAGFLVSPSALVDHTVNDLADPLRYVDAATVPYVSIPSEMLAIHGGPLHMGDVAMVWRAGRVCAAIVGDDGPEKKYGEGSIALAKALNLPPSPRNGGCDAGVVYIVWPGSATTPAWPRTNEAIAAQANALFATWGGASSAAALLHK